MIKNMNFIDVLNIIFTALNIILIIANIIYWWFNNRYYHSLFNYHDSYREDYYNLLLEIYKSNGIDVENVKLLMDIKNQIKGK